MTRTIEIAVQVPFFDVDSMHMAWHGHYAKYFELARCRLLEDLGHDYDAMLASGYAWPIVDMRIRYMRPLRFNQHLRVIARLIRWDERLRIGYRIRDRDSGAILARGHTIQAPIDLQTGELFVGQPEAVREALAQRASPSPTDKVRY